jgi:DNA-binding transcriptional regulator YiaG
MSITSIRPRNIRRTLGLTQEEFWSMIGVTQSAGSRYERGRAMPKPVAALMGLVYGNGIAPLSGQIDRVNGEMVKTNLKPREIRYKLGLSQLEFWSNIGTTQSAGSRYESGRAMPRPVQTLLHLVKTNWVKSPAKFRNRFRAASTLASQFAI